MGWAKIASGARISKIRSVRAHTAASRSPVVSAMGYPPGSGKLVTVYVGPARAATSSAGAHFGLARASLIVGLSQTTLGVLWPGLRRPPSRTDDHALSSVRLHGRGRPESDARGGRASRAHREPQEPAPEIFLRHHRRQALRGHH